MLKHPMFHPLAYFSVQVFLTSGLGGMSGAQPKAAVISGCIGVVAEVIIILFAEIKINS